MSFHQRGLKENIKNCDIAEMKQKMLGLLTLLVLRVLSKDSESEQAESVVDFIYATVE